MLAGAILRQRATLLEAEDARTSIGRQPLAQFA
jgi:hypothetical protein